MKKQSKSLLIAVAAFAVTATGVSAHTGTRILNRAGLNDAQIAAIETARELREAGDLTGARDALVDAEISEDVLKKISKAARKTKSTIRQAIEDEDFETFVKEAEGTPLADQIVTEEDFQLFIEAHELQEAGEYEEAQEIFDELGIEKNLHQNHRRYMLEELTDEQASAFETAKEANDKETMQSILEEAGIDCHVR